MNFADAVPLIRAEIRDLVAVYLFGSLADGSEHPGSDVDLAFLAPRPVEPARRFDLQERLALALQRNVDLVDLAAAATVMRMQVVSRGKVLAEFDPAQREGFEDFVYSSFARLNEERKGILDRVVREGTVHGR